MADLPHTICFRASQMLWEELREMAREKNRRLGDLVRILVEEKVREVGDGSKGN